MNASSAPPVITLPAHGQRKPTVGEWLENLRERLARCTDRNEVEAELLTDEVCRAASTLTGTARDELALIMDAAVARHDTNDEPGGARESLACQNVLAEPTP